jgi:hypothetical protein
LKQTFESRGKFGCAFWAEPFVDQFKNQNPLLVGLRRPDKVKKGRNERTETRSLVVVEI